LKTDIGTTGVLSLWSLTSGNVLRGLPQCVRDNHNRGRGRMAQTRRRREAITVLPSASKGEVQHRDAPVNQSAGFDRLFQMRGSKLGDGATAAVFIRKWGLLRKGPEKRRPFTLNMMAAGEFHRWDPNSLLDYPTPRRREHTKIISRANLHRSPLYAG